MKVILRDDVEKLGKAGEPVNVKSGYARNFLVPRGLAYVATPGALKRIEEEMKQLSRKIGREKIDAEEYAQKLSTVSITIPMKVGDEEKLYGSVTAQMISDSLGNLGYAIDKRAISLDEQIKTLGSHEVAIKLKHGVQGKVKVNVTAQ
ncbi:MAG: 50S ribosomal protein L9 [Candidatus Kapaibacterium sp.]|jgi:large subunit ribosomal protein L9